MQSMYEFQTLSWNSGIFLNVTSKEQIGVRGVSGQKCDPHSLS